MLSALLQLFCGRVAGYDFEDLFKQWVEEKTRGFTAEMPTDQIRTAIESFTKVALDVDTDFTTYKKDIVGEFARLR